MKVKVNNKIITIFNGAEVKDVIRKYSTKEYKKVKKGNKIITDKNGNQVMPTGELMGDEELNIINKKN
ncbi:MAG: hypothetical protein U5K53_06560 [Halanaerobiales bacterium]|nr:hypothetical protein [Halanaerobiales bacterium]